MVDRDIEQGSPRCQTGKHWADCPDPKTLVNREVRDRRFHLRRGIVMYAHHVHHREGGGVLGIEATVGLITTVSGGKAGNRAVRWHIREGSPGQFELIGSDEQTS